MTESEWLALDDPDRIWQALPARPSDRKLRLFACACCRTVGPGLLAGASVVDAAERFADGLISEVELQDAGLPPSYAIGTDGHLWNAMEWLTDLDGINSTGAALEVAVAAEMGEQRRLRQPNTHDLGPEQIRTAGNQVREAVRRAQGVLLRDVLGNPFRPVLLDAAWRTADVVRIAQSIYDRGSETFEHLASALEAAGCRSADILDHCRSNDAHVRGCWLIDLIVDKA